MLMPPSWCRKPGRAPGGVGRGSRAASHRCGDPMVLGCPTRSTRDRVRTISSGYLRSGWGAQNRDFRVRGRGLRTPPVLRPLSPVGPGCRTRTSASSEGPDPSPQCRSRRIPAGARTRRSGLRIRIRCEELGVWGHVRASNSTPSGSAWASCCPAFPGASLPRSRAPPEGPACQGLGCSIRAAMYFVSSRRQLEPALPVAAYAPSGGLQVLDPLDRAEQPPVRPERGRDKGIQRRRDHGLRDPQGRSFANSRTPQRHPDTTRSPVFVSTARRADAPSISSASSRRSGRPRRLPRQGHRSNLDSWLPMALGR